MKTLASPSTSSTVSVCRGDKIRLYQPKEFELFKPSGDHKSDFEQIIEKAPKLKNERNVREQLNLAFHVASKVHEGQRRKDGDRDYIVHPLGVLHYTAVVLGGTNVPAIVSLLHDVLEEAQKRGKGVEYYYIKHRFNSRRIADDLAYVTTPKCKGPRENRQPWQSPHEWIFADNPDYPIYQDYYKKIGASYSPEVYLEMRAMYLKRLLSPAGIRSFVIKLADAIDNLSDIEHLSEERRSRKLAEDTHLIKIAARLDWQLYEMMAHFLAEWDIEVPDLSDEIASQQAAGIVICRPRKQLDFVMASEELPIQHPLSPVISVYADTAEIHEEDKLEIGLPRLNNGGRLHMLKETFPSLEFTVGRSLFYGYFDLAAKDSIYSVSGLSARTSRSTRKNFETFLDGLRRLQSELAESG